MTVETNIFLLVIKEVLTKEESIAIYENIVKPKVDIINEFTLETGIENFYAVAFGKSSCAYFIYDPNKMIVNVIFVFHNTEKVSYKEFQDIVRELMMVYELNWHTIQMSKDGIHDIDVQSDIIY